MERRKGPSGDYFERGLSVAFSSSFLRALLLFPLSALPVSSYDAPRNPTLAYRGSSSPAPLSLPL